MSAAVQMGEYDSEPIRGLPELLPEGERILWQGAPCWRRLARSAFHTTKVAIYFALLVAWRSAAAIAGQEPLLEAVWSVARLALLGLAALGLLAAMAWLQSRATVYTITDRRVVIRFGVALTLAVNVPFRSIQSAALKAHADGTGDIALTVTDAGRIGYLMLWPHVRPWRFGSAVQPTLRSLPQALAVAEMLTDAVGDTARRAPARSDEASGLRAGASPVATALS